ncbi:MAG: preprotein translocase subunit SecE [Arenicellales bacterium]|nr:preprotein translocase subunit SecE [Arenicellales bacterium]
MIDKVKLAAAVLIVVLGLAGFYYFDEQSVLLRAGMVIVAVVAGLAVALLSAPGQAAWEFAKGARLELRKVVWPTRRETVQGTGMVLLMVILIGIYLWIMDTILFWVIYDLVLGTGT